jgi:hypothetical protein
MKAGKNYYLRFFPEDPEGALSSQQPKTALGRVTGEVSTCRPNVLGYSRYRRQVPACVDLSS